MNIKGSGISRRGVLAAAGTFAATNLPFVRSSRAQQPKLDSINIIRSAGNLTSVLDELMAQQGAWTKFKLAPSITSASDGAKLLGPLLTGEMDICPLSGFANIF